MKPLHSNGNGRRKHPATSAKTPKCRAEEDQLMRQVIAANVKRRREALGLSPAALARAIGCDRARIGKIEAAKISPAAPLYLRLARALETTAESLAEETIHSEATPTSRRTLKKTRLL